MGCAIVGACLCPTPILAGDIPYAPSSPLALPAWASSNPQTWHLDMIGASVAYGRGFTGAGVVVTVADSGVDINHPALAGKVLLQDSRNYMLAAPGQAYDPTQQTPSEKKDMHGSHVSGIIAARQVPGIDMHGVAYDAELITIRVLADHGTSAVPAPGLYPTYEAMNYFAGLPNSVSMIYNASYGPSIPRDAPPQYVWNVQSEKYDDHTYAAARALQAGKIIVAANGNDRESNPAGKNPSGLALLPFLHPSHANLGVYNDGGEGIDFTGLQNQPGQIVAVMSVGADKQPATYSNFCGVTASWCVAAPGGDISKTFGIVSTVPYGEYETLHGTSMAAPVVSGALAVLLQANPAYNAQDLAHLLFSTTEDLGDPGLDKIYGHGLIKLDRATEGPTTLSADVSVPVAVGVTEYWSRPLVTSGGFTKDGDGILTISGRTDAMGRVSAAGGTLAVDGTLGVGNHGLTIGQAATLAGFGTVNGDTAVDGTLSPGKMANFADLQANNFLTPSTVRFGNSAGTLTFNGNVTLAPTATTQIDIDGMQVIPGGPGTYDKVIVSGAGHTFWASGTLVPVLRGTVGTPSNYVPSLGNNFDIVQAVNGARTSGTFNALTQPADSLLSQLRLDLIYNNAFIALAVTPQSFAEFASHAQLGPASRVVADMLDRRRVAPGEMPSASDKALYDAIYRLPDDNNYAGGLYQLTGPGQSAVMSAMTQTFQGFMGPIADRQNAHVLNGSAGMVGTAQAFAMAYDGRIMNAATTQAFASIDHPKAEQGWSVWGQGFGRLATVNATGELAGSRTTGTGFVMGADRIVSASLLAGGAFGFARTSTSSEGMTGTSDTYAGAAYATWTPGAAKLDMRVAAGPSQISTARQTILMPGAIGGAVNGFGTAINLEAGYLIPMWQQAVLQPFAGLGWQGFRRNAYVENQQPFGLAYGAQFYDKLTATLGLSLSAQLLTLDGTTLMPELRIGWGHDLRDTTLVTQAALLDAPFMVEGARPGRDAGLVGVKLSGWRSENFRLYGSYNGEFRSNAISHQVAAGARFSW